MIKKKATMEKGYDKSIHTMINTDVTIEGGTLRSVNTVRFDGTCKGDLICEGSLIVGETGRIEGNVHAQNILFCGYIEGNIKADNECHLGNSSTVIGNIQCGSFIVDEGAAFKGQCEMNTAVNQPTKIADEKKKKDAKKAS